LEQSTRHLLAITIGGVQAFISEARKTSDLHNASDLISQLASVISLHLQANRDAAGIELVFPNGSAASAPNRVVAQSVKDPTQTCEAAVTAARTWWAQHATASLNAALVSRSSGGDHNADGAAATSPVPVPEPPEITWVVVSGSSYAQAWNRLRQAALARKRTRKFSPFTQPVGRICAMTGRFAAVPTNQVKPWASQGNETGEHLSALGWFKRVPYCEISRFASTRELAATIYKIDLATAGWSHPDHGERIRQHISDLVDVAGELKLDTANQAVAPAVDGLARKLDNNDRDHNAAKLLRLHSSLLDPQSWTADGFSQELGVPDLGRDWLDFGKSEAEALRSVAIKAGLRCGLDRLAIVASDVDDLGQTLNLLAGSGNADTGLEQHRALSQTLGALAKDQQQLAASLAIGAQVVYAGGDDSLVMGPAATALDLADGLCQITSNGLSTATGTSVTASASVVIMPPHFPLQPAVRRAQAAITAAKDAGRPGLEIVSIAGNGERDLVRASFSRDLIGKLATLVTANLGGASLSVNLAAVAHTIAGSELLIENELARLLGRRLNATGNETHEPRALAQLMIQCARPQSQSIRPQHLVNLAHLISTLEGVGWPPNGSN